jgi:hypothetical protein
MNNMNDYGDEDHLSFTWNHRVLKTTSEFEGILEENYTIVECQYRDGKPSSCCDPFLTADSVEGLQGLLAQMQTALTKPVIFVDDLTSFHDLDILARHNEDDNA